MKKSKLNNTDLAKYKFYDEECTRLHKLIRQEKDKKKLLGYLDELIRNYDRMNSLVRPSMMERIGIKHIVRMRNALRKSKYDKRPKDVPDDAELERMIKEKKVGDVVSD
jgi:hypothetical protein